MAKARASSDEDILLVPRKSSRVWTFVAFPAVLVALGAGYWFLLRDPGPTPQDLFRQAITSLDAGENLTAYETAKALEALKYRDPDFDGGVPFILGVIAFRDAEALDEESRLRNYEKTVTLLREAAHMSLAESHRPEWEYVLGAALHRRGDFNAARPLLEDAVRDFVPGRIAATNMLLETYLHSRNPVDLEAGLRLSQNVLKLKTISTDDRNRALLQQAQLLFELGQKTAAEQSLQAIVGESERDQSLNVLHAQTLLSEGKPKAAREILQPATRAMGLEESYARQAWLLLGICNERLGDEATLQKNSEQAELYYQAALTTYKETALKYERDHEALAAWLQAADLYRRQQRSEEALEAYRAALQLLPDPDTFRNRWLDLADFRERVTRAWQDWNASKQFEEALVIAGMMEPLFPKYVAHQSTAQTHQQWAEELERQAQTMKYAARRAQLLEIRRRWVLSGEAFAAAAESHQTGAEYSQLVWSSAENLFHGHGYQAAIEQYTRFLNSGTTTQVAVSWVRRGQAWLNVGNVDEALRQFQHVTEQHPTDPIVYEAHYLSGICKAEQQKLDEAETIWHALITSSDLSPKAQEWVKSLYALANLTSQHAESLRGEALLLEGQTPEGPRRKLEQQAYDRWQQAAVLWDQFLERYPAAEQSIQARYALAKARQRTAEWLLQMQYQADNENARTNFSTQRQVRLGESLAEFHAVFVELRQLEDSENLDPLHAALLRNTQFEIAHSEFMLGNFTRALDGFSTAANRYQNHPSAVLACVLMVECHLQLGQKTEARSMLEVARRTLDKLPDAAFERSNTELSRAEWQDWLTRIIAMQPVEQLTAGPPP